MKENTKEILKPTNDYVFRKIFGSVGNEDITRDLLEKVLNVRYNKIDLSKNPVLLPETIDGKGNILDVVIQAEERENINIEMQVARYDYMAERILEYWAKKYSDEFKTGEDYFVAKRTVCILITCFEMNQVKDIQNFHTKWNIREEKSQDIILTDKLEFHIINLKKLESKPTTLMDEELLKWCKFISSPETLEEKIMEENKNIEKANEILCSLSADELERDLAYRRERATRDINTARKSGYNEGKQDGIQEGIKEGKINEKYNIAQKLLEQKIEIEIVAKVTGLSIDEIKKLKS